MADLPTDIKFGHVVLSAVYAVGDTTDDVNREPDAVPAVGTVTFTPVLKQVVSTVAPARFVLVQTVECELDPTGRMIDGTGADGVWLVTGVYDVTFAIQNATISGFQILVEDTHTELAPLDLTIAAPLVIPPPYIPVVDSSLYADTVAARDETIALADSYVVDGEVVGDDLILTRSGGGTINAGNVRGADGDPGAPGADGISGSPLQPIPPVGGTIVSSFFDTQTTATLRDRGTAPMPLLLHQTIGVDQASFNLAVLAAAAGQTAQLQLKKLDPGASAWTTVSTLATGIPLASPAVTGIVTISFAEIILTAGIVWGFALSEQQAFDGTLRVTQGVMHGPGIGMNSGFAAGYNLPIGANTSTVTGIPLIRLRRSS